VNAIWKYTIQGPRVTLEMPQGAKIVSLQVQDNQPQIWALVDPSEWKISRTFRALPTGVEFNAAGLTYVGTFQINDGTLVFHIFEETA
jgi:hypothetical protein